MKTGAAENNLKNPTVDFPLGEFVAVTGVFWFIKWHSVNTILKKALAQKMNRNSAKPGQYKTITVHQNLENVTCRQNRWHTQKCNHNLPVSSAISSYSLTMKQVQGYKKGAGLRVKRSGRCEACKGDRIIKIEMNFLPDVYPL